MGYVVDACGQVQESRILQTLHHLRRQLVCHAHVSVARRGLMTERYLLLHDEGS